MNSESGGAAIEFALIAPIFFVMLFGIIELGRMFYMEVTLRQAVEQAARFAMAEYTRESFFQADCTNFASWVAGPWEATLETQAELETIAVDPSLIDFSQTTVTPGTPDTLNVTGTYTFTFLFQIVPSMSTLTLSASSTTPLFGNC